MIPQKPDKPGLSGTAQHADAPAVLWRWPYLLEGPAWHCVQESKWYDERSCSIAIRMRYQREQLRRLVRCRLRKAPAWLQRPHGIAAFAWRCIFHDEPRRSRARGVKSFRFYGQGHTHRRSRGALTVPRRVKGLLRHYKAIVDATRCYYAATTSPESYKPQRTKRLMLLGERKGI